MPAVWDTQCMFDGTLLPGSILQIACSNHHIDMYDCAQYSDLCKPELVRDYLLPAQKIYVGDAAPLGAKKGSGGFMHTCFLGAYFFNNYKKNFTDNKGQHHVTPPDKLGIWQQIEVGGISMRDAISRWWHAADGAPPQLHVDALWDPSGTPPHDVTVDGIASSLERTAKAPPVPWYTSRYMQNPTCRGFPWY